MNKGIIPNYNLKFLKYRHLGILGSVFVFLLIKIINFSFAFLGPNDAAPKRWHPNFRLPTVGVWHPNVRIHGSENFRILSPQPPIFLNKKDDVQSFAKQALSQIFRLISFNVSINNSNFYLSFLQTAKDCALN